MLASVVPKNKIAARVAWLLRQGQSQQHGAIFSSRHPIDPLIFGSAYLQARPVVGWRRCCMFSLRAEFELLRVPRTSEKNGVMMAEVDVFYCFETPIREFVV